MHIPSTQRVSPPQSLFGGLAEGFVFYAPLLLRELSERQHGAGLDLEEDAEKGRERHPLLVCRNCGQAITGEDRRIAVAGSHRHTFFNPAGIVYGLGCFSEANGCVLVGPRSPEFSWFAGCLWRVALCRGCGNHLGWHFQGDGQAFYGLILAELIAIE